MFENIQSNSDSDDVWLDSFSLHVIPHFSKARKISLESVQSVSESDDIRFDSFFLHFIQKVLHMFRTFFTDANHFVVVSYIRLFDILKDGPSIVGVLALIEQIHPGGSAVA